MYALNSIAVEQIDQAKQGSTFSRINIAQIMEVLIPVPPPSTQTAIADELDQIWETTRIGISLVERQIALLEERRDALITAAVTGAILIAGAA
jgi:restriction endonuclease S subunit